MQLIGAILGLLGVAAFGFAEWSAAVHILPFVVYSSFLLSCLWANFKVVTDQLLDGKVLLIVVFAIVSAMSFAFYCLGQYLTYCRGLACIGH